MECFTRRDRVKLDEVFAKFESFDLVRYFLLDI